MMPRESAVLSSLAGARRVCVEVLGESVEVQTDDRFGEGGNVWSAVVRIAGFMESCKVSLRGARVLELGSGTGVLAIACARKGASVVATEAPWMLELLSLNAELAAPQNAAAGGSLTVREFLWSKQPHAALSSLKDAWPSTGNGQGAANTPPPQGGDFDVVLACECVYSMEEGSLGEIFGHAHGSTAGDMASCGGRVYSGRVLIREGERER